VKLADDDDPRITVGDLFFPDDLPSLGIDGTAPDELNFALGAIPRTGDVLGFSELRYQNGEAAMFHVLRTFHHCREGRVVRVSFLLGLAPAASVKISDSA
jgi:hypothetical protein